MQKPSIRVQVNPAKLAAAGIDLEQLRDAGQRHRQPAQGRALRHQQAYTLATGFVIDCKLVCRY
jgi:multidrug efflux pump subunit AcrB